MERKEKKMTKGENLDTSPSSNKVDVHENPLPLREISGDGCAIQNRNWGDVCLTSLNSYFIISL